MPSCYNLEENTRVPFGEMTDPNNRENQTEYIETRKRVEAARVKIEKNKKIVKKMIDKEMDEITKITDNLRNNMEFEELLNVLEVLEEYHIQIPTEDNNPVRFFTMEQIKLELNSIVNSIIHDFDNDDVIDV